MNLKGKLIIGLTIGALLIPTASFADTATTITEDQKQIVKELFQDVRNGDMTKEEARIILGDMGIEGRGQFNKEITEDMKTARALRQEFKSGNITEDELKEALSELDLPAREVTEDMETAKALKEELNAGTITKEEFRAALSELDLPKISQRINRVTEDMKTAKALREDFQAGNITLDELKEALSQLNLPDRSGVARPDKSELNPRSAGNGTQNSLFSNPFGEQIDF